jgi:hypothetical protein
LLYFCFRWGPFCNVSELMHFLLPAKKKKKTFS